MVSGTTNRVTVPNNVMWAVHGLKLDPVNARKHSKENIRAIKASLERFGQQKPIVVMEDGTVKAGNGTVIAAEELGWDKIWVRVTDLQGDEADMYAVADNRSAELAVWDDDVLSEKLRTWPEGDSVLFDALGFDQDDILEPDLSSLDVDMADIDLGGQDPIGDAMILLRIQIPQRKDDAITAQREIQEICDKYGLILESRVQI